MTNLDTEICFKLRDCRRRAKISQSELASEVGCAQSALSMFECGQPTKLSEETVKKIAQKFGVVLKSDGPSAPVQPAPGGFALARTGFCPNGKCPSNSVYTVDGRVLVRPDLGAADPVGGRFCACCGEVLERRCPSCGAPVHAGAICSFCGEAYVAVV